ncbi:MAG: hypothetical protein GY861_11230, partial [bacterium]|nr:hypothetical protein [bacterium]
VNRRYYSGGEKLDTVGDVTTVEPGKGVSADGPNDETTIEAEFEPQTLQGLIEKRYGPGGESISVTPQSGAFDEIAETQGLNYKEQLEEANVGGASRRQIGVKGSLLGLMDSATEIEEFRQQMANKGLTAKEIYDSNYRINYFNHNRSFTLSTINLEIENGLRMGLLVDVDGKWKPGQSVRNLRVKFSPLVAFLASEHDAYRSFVLDLSVKVMVNGSFSGRTSKNPLGWATIPGKYNGSIRRQIKEVATDCFAGHFLRTEFDGYFDEEDGLKLKKAQKLILIRKDEILNQRALSAIVDLIFSSYDSTRDVGYDLISELSNDEKHLKVLLRIIKSRQFAERVDLLIEDADVFWLLFEKIQNTALRSALLEHEAIVSELAEDILHQLNERRGRIGGDDLIEITYKLNPEQRLALAKTLDKTRLVDLLNTPTTYLRDENTKLRTIKWISGIPSDMKSFLLKDANIADAYEKTGKSDMFDESVGTPAGMLEFVAKQPRILTGLVSKRGLTTNEMEKMMAGLRRVNKKVNPKTGENEPFKKTTVRLERSGLVEAGIFVPAQEDVVDEYSGARAQAYHFESDIMAIFNEFGAVAVVDICDELIKISVLNRQVFPKTGDARQLVEHRKNQLVNQARKKYQSNTDSASSESEKEYSIIPADNARRLVRLNRDAVIAAIREARIDQVPFEGFQQDIRDDFQNKFNRTIARIVDSFIRIGGSEDLSRYVGGYSYGDDKLVEVWLDAVFLLDGSKLEIMFTTTVHDGLDQAAHGHDISQYRTQEDYDKSVVIAIPNSNYVVKDSALGFIRENLTASELNKLSNYLSVTAMGISQKTQNLAVSSLENIISARLEDPLGLGVGTSLGIEIPWKGRDIAKEGRGVYEYAIFIDVLGEPENGKLLITLGIEQEIHTSERRTQPKPYYNFQLINLELSGSGLNIVDLSGDLLLPMVKDIPALSYPVIPVDDEFAFIKLNRAMIIAHAKEAEAARNPFDEDDYKKKYFAEGIEKQIEEIVSGFIKDKGREVACKEDISYTYDQVYKRALRLSARIVSFDENGLRVKFITSIGRGIDQRTVNHDVSNKWSVSDYDKMVTIPTQPSKKSLPGVGGSLLGLMDSATEIEEFRNAIASEEGITAKEIYNSNYRINSKNDDKSFTLPTIDSEIENGLRTGLLVDVDDIWQPGQSVRNLRVKFSPLVAFLVQHYPERFPSFVDRLNMVKVDDHYRGYTGENPLAWRTISNSVIYKEQVRHQIDRAILGVIIDLIASLSTEGRFGEEWRQTFRTIIESLSPEQRKIIDALKLRKMLIFFFDDEGFDTVKIQVLKALNGGMFKLTKMVFDSLFDQEFQESIEAFAAFSSEGGLVFEPVLEAQYYARQLLEKVEAYQAENFSDQDGKESSEVIITLHVLLSRVLGENLENNPAKLLEIDGNKSSVVEIIRRMVGDEIPADGIDSFVEEFIHGREHSVVSKSRFEKDNKGLTARERVAIRLYGEITRGKADLPIIHIRFEKTIEKHAKIPLDDNKYRWGVENSTKHYTELDIGLSDFGVEAFNVKTRLFPAALIDFMQFTLDTEKVWEELIEDGLTVRQIADLTDSETKLSSEEIASGFEAGLRTGLLVDASGAWKLSDPVWDIRIKLSPEMMFLFETPHNARNFNGQLKELFNAKTLKGVKVEGSPNWYMVSECALEEAESALHKILENEAVAGIIKIAKSNRYKNIGRFFDSEKAKRKKATAIEGGIETILRGLRGGLGNVTAELSFFEKFDNQQALREKLVLEGSMDKEGIVLVTTSEAGQYTHFSDDNWQLSQRYDTDTCRFRIKALYNYRLESETRTASNLTMPGVGGSLLGLMKSATEIEEFRNAIASEEGITAKEIYNSNYRINSNGGESFYLETIKREIENGLRTGLLVVVGDGVLREGQSVWNLRVRLCPEMAFLANYPEAFVTVVANLGERINLGSFRGRTGTNPLGWGTIPESFIGAVKGAIGEIIVSNFSSRQFDNSLPSGEFLIMVPEAEQNNNPEEFIKEHLHHELVATLRNSFLTNIMGISLENFDDKKDRIISELQSLLDQAFDSFLEPNGQADNAIDIPLWWNEKYSCRYSFSVVKTAAVRAGKLPITLLMERAFIKPDGGRIEHYKPQTIELELHSDRTAGLRIKNREMIVGDLRRNIKRHQEVVVAKVMEKVDEKITGDINEMYDDIENHVKEAVGLFANRISQTIYSSPGSEFEEEVSDEKRNITSANVYANLSNLGPNQEYIIIKVRTFFGEKNLVDGQWVNKEPVPQNSCQFKVQFTSQGVDVSPHHDSTDSASEQLAIEPDNRHAFIKKHLNNDKIAGVTPYLFTSVMGIPPLREREALEKLSSVLDKVLNDLSESEEAVGDIIQIPWRVGASNVYQYTIKAKIDGEVRDGKLSITLLITQNELDSDAKKLSSSGQGTIMFELSSESLDVVDSLGSLVPLVENMPAAYYVTVPADDPFAFMRLNYFKVLAQAQRRLKPYQFKEHFQGAFPAQIGSVIREMGKWSKRHAEDLVTNEHRDGHTTYLSLVKGGIESFDGSTLVIWLQAGVQRYEDSGMRYPRDWDPAPTKITIKADERRVSAKKPPVGVGGSLFGFMHSALDFEELRDKLTSEEGIAAREIYDSNYRINRKNNDQSFTLPTIDLEIENGLRTGLLVDIDGNWKLGQSVRGVRVKFNPLVALLSSERDAYRSFVRGLAERVKIDGYFPGRTGNNPLGWRTIPGKYNRSIKSQIAKVANACFARHFLRPEFGVMIARDATVKLIRAQKLILIRKDEILNRKILTAIADLFFSHYGSNLEIGCDLINDISNNEKHLKIFLEIIKSREFARKMNTAIDEIGIDTILLLFTEISNPSIRSALLKHKVIRLELAKDILSELGEESNDIGGDDLIAITYKLNYEERLALAKALDKERLLGFLQMSPFTSLSAENINLRTIKWISGIPSDMKRFLFEDANIADAYEKTEKSDMFDKSIGTPAGMLEFAAKQPRILNALASERGLTTNEMEVMMTWLGRVNKKVNPKTGRNEPFKRETVRLERRELVKAGIFVSTGMVTNENNGSSAQAYCFNDDIKAIYKQFGVKAVSDICIKHSRSRALNSRIISDDGVALPSIQILKGIHADEVVRDYTSKDPLVVVSENILFEIKANIGSSGGQILEKSLITVDGLASVVSDFEDNGEMVIRNIDSEGGEGQKTKIKITSIPDGLRAEYSIPQIDGPPRAGVVKVVVPSTLISKIKNVPDSTNDEEISGGINYKAVDTAVEIKGEGIYNFPTQAFPIKFNNFGGFGCKIMSMQRNDNPDKVFAEKKKVLKAAGLSKDNNLPRGSNRRRSEIPPQPLSLVSNVFLRKDKLNKAQGEYHVTIFTS